MRFGQVGSPELLELQLRGACGVCERVRVENDLGASRGVAVELFRPAPNGCNLSDSVPRGDTNYGGGQERRQHTATKHEMLVHGEPPNVPRGPLRRY
jgi:hypothetical protein